MKITKNKTDSSSKNEVPKEVLLFDSLGVSKIYPLCKSDIVVTFSFGHHDPDSKGWALYRVGDQLIRHKWESFMVDRYTLMSPGEATKELCDMYRYQEAAMVARLLDFDPEASAPKPLLLQVATGDSVWIRGSDLEYTVVAAGNDERSLTCKAIKPHNHPVAYEAESQVSLSSICKWEEKRQ